MAWVLLTAAIVAEVIATLALRGTATGWKPLPVVLVVVGYVCAFGLLAYALRTLKVGPVYAIWSGVGTAGVAVAAVFLYDERLSLPMIVGVVLIVAGVAVLSLSGGAYH